MEDIAYHESFVRNSMVFAYKKDNNQMEDCQGHQKIKLRGWTKAFLIDPKSDPSVSKVVQQTYVVYNSTMRESSTQAILSKTTLQPIWNDTA